MPRASNLRLRKKKQETVAKAMEAFVTDKITREKFEEYLDLITYQRPREEKLDNTITELNRVLYQRFERKQQKKAAKAEKVARKRRDPFEKMMSSLREYVQNSPGNMVTLHVRIYKDITPDQIPKLPANSNVVEEDGTFYYEMKKTSSNQPLSIQCSKANFLNALDKINTTFNTFPALMGVENIQEFMFAILKENAGNRDFRYFVVVQNDIYGNIVTFERIITTDNQTYTPRQLQPLRDTQYAPMIISKYIRNETNPQAKTLEELFIRGDKFKVGRCVPDVLVMHFARAFQKAQGKGKYKSVNWSHEGIFKMIRGREPVEGDDWGFTFEEIVEKVLTPYRLGFVTIDKDDKTEIPELTYKPNTRNTHLTPSVAYVKIESGHLYLLNENLKSLTHSFNGSKSNSDTNLSVGSRFKIIKQRKHREFAATPEDIVKIINSEEMKNQSKISICYSGYLDDLLKTFIVDVNYQVHAGLSPMRKVTHIHFMYGEKSITITPPGSDTDVETAYQINFKDAEYRDKFERLNLLMYLSLVNTNNMSTYNDQTATAFRIGSQTALRGFFDLDKETIEEIWWNRNIYENDGCKEYAAIIAKQIEFVPVISKFDYFQKTVVTSVEQIENCNFYYVKLKSKFFKTMKNSDGTTYELNIYDRYKRMLIDSRYNVIPGLVLKKHYEDLKDDITIKAVLRPYKLVPNYSCDVIKQIMESDLHPTDKKQMLVSNIGQIGKQKNHKVKTTIFNKRDDAVEFQKQHGGEVKLYVFGKDPTTYDPTCYVVAEENITEPHFYYVNQEAEKYLTNGFLPFHNLMYSIMRMNLYEKTVELSKKGSYPISVNTDCVYTISCDPIETYTFDRNNYDNIGKFSVNHCPNFIKKFIGKNKEFELKKLHYGKIERDEDFLKLEKLNYIVHSVVDEYNTPAICDTLETLKRCIILGIVPGVGKTFIATQLAKRYQNPLFIVPTNKRIRDMKLQHGLHNVKTIYDALHLKVDDSNMDEVVGGNAAGLAEYDAIFIDEICQFTVSELAALAHIMLVLFPDKVYIATGDPYQNPPIQNMTVDQKQYYSYILRLLFQNELVLKVNKRHKSQKDKDTVEAIKQDLFDGMSIPDVIKKYKFETVDTLGKDDRAIVYTNRKAAEVNLQLHKMNHGEDVPIYAKGVEIVAKQRIVKSGVTIHNGFTYTIKAFDDKEFVIEDVATNEVITLDPPAMRYFALPYAYTCHVVQGDTIECENGNIVIYESGAPYVSAEWFYTAITRTTELSRVKIYHDGYEWADFVVNMKKFNERLEQYKEQDRKANRPFDEKDYVNWEWIKKRYGKQYGHCLRCYGGMDFDLSVISVDRINNALPHTTKNCFLSHIKCNCAAQ